MSNDDGYDATELTSTRLCRCDIISRLVTLDKEMIALEAEHLLMSETRRTKLLDGWHASQLESCISMIKSKFDATQEEINAAESTIMHAFEMNDTTFDFEVAIQKNGCGSGGLPQCRLVRERHEQHLNLGQDCEKICFLARTVRKFAEENDEQLRADTSFMSAHQSKLTDACDRSNAASQSDVARDMARLCLDSDMAPITAIQQPPLTADDAPTLTTQQPGQTNIAERVEARVERVADTGTMYMQEEPSPTPALVATTVPEPPLTAPPGPPLLKGTHSYRELSSKGKPIGQVKKIDHTLLMTTEWNVFYGEAGAKAVKLLTSPNVLKLLRTAKADTKRVGGEVKGVERIQVNGGLTCATENSANVELEVASLDGKLVTEEQCAYNSLDVEEVKRLLYSPLPWSTRGDAAFAENEEVYDALMDIVIEMDSKMAELSPDHHIDMVRATQAVEIRIPTQALVDAFREQLGPNSENRLSHIRDDAYRLDVRLLAGYAGAESSGITNLTINIQRLLMKLIKEKGIDLKDVIVVLKHLDGGDMHPSDEFPHGGVGFTSPFYTNPELCGGEFAAILDSVNLSGEPVKTPFMHSSLGTLYGIAHLVYAAFLPDGFDVSALTEEELENIIRGSVIVQARDSLVQMLGLLKKEPNPKVFDRGAKRQAFRTGKAELSEGFADLFLSVTEGIDTDHWIENSPMWRAHQSILLEAAQQPVNQAVIDRRRAFWEKKAERDAKQELTEEQVQAIATLGLDRIVPPYLERDRSQF